MAEPGKLDWGAGPVPLFPWGKDELSPGKLPCGLVLVIKVPGELRSDKSVLSLASEALTRAELLSVAGGRPFTEEPDTCREVSPTDKELDARVPASVD